MPSSCSPVITTRFGASSTSSERRRIERHAEDARAAAADLRRARAHTRIEEDIFYPVRDLGDDELTDTVTEGLQEHHVVKVLMREIRELSDEDIFEAKMTVLIENVEHHADEEESELFPELREKMSEERLDELGANSKPPK